MDDFATAMLCVSVAVRYCEPYRPSHSEEASLHPGLYKRLRAVVVGFLAIAVMEVDL